MRAAGALYDYFRIDSHRMYPMDIYSEYLALSQLASYCIHHRIICCSFSMTGRKTRLMMLILLMPGILYLATLGRAISINDKWHYVKQA